MKVKIVKRIKKSEDQKTAIKNIKTLYESQEKVIQITSNYLMIIPELYLKLDTKQNMEKVSKY